MLLTDLLRWFERLFGCGVFNNILLKALNSLEDLSELLGLERYSLVVVLDLLDVVDLLSLSLRLHLHNGLFQFLLTLVLVNNAVDEFVLA